MFPTNLNGRLTRVHTRHVNLINSKKKENQEETTGFAFSLAYCRLRSIYKRVGGPCSHLEKEYKEKDTAGSWLTPTYIIVLVLISQSSVMENAGVLCMHSSCSIETVKKATREKKRKIIHSNRRYGTKFLLAKRNLISIKNF
jgi:hypothetical protein